MKPMKVSIKTISRNIFLLGMLAVFTNSCKKETIDSDTNTAKDENTAEQSFTEIGDMSDEVAKTNNLSSFKTGEDDGVLISECVVISFDTTGEPSLADPHSITLDFGTSCVGNDGKTRSGKIIITYTGRYFEQGTIITTTPENYFVNGNGVTGFRKVTNLGTTALGQPTFSVEVNGTIVLPNNGGAVTWTANRNRTWTAGYDTPFYFYDDVNSITGGANGTKANGGSWTSQISDSDPLVFKRSCRQIVSGIITITPSSKPVRVVNFGSGDCDHQATVAINGNTYTISTQ